MYQAEATLYSDTPPQVVWEYISKYQNLAAFLSHIREVKPKEDAVLEWNMGGSLGIPLSWKTIITQSDRKKLAWKSFGSPMETYGWITVQAEGRGSRITMSLVYNPPKGAIAEMFTRMFKDPQTILENDLKRLESILAGQSTISGL